MTKRRRVIKKNPDNRHVGDVIAVQYGTGRSAVIGRADSFAGVDKCVAAADLRTCDQPTWTGEVWEIQVR